MSKTQDENDRAIAGTLPADPAAGTARVRPALRAVGPDEKPKPGVPCDLAAERALLGALLWAGTNAPDLLRISSVTDIVDAGDKFYSGQFGAIYDAVVGCAAEKKEHDPVAVHAHLASVGKHQSTGGIEVLRGLVETASTVSEKQARVYANTIRNMWARRQAIADARTIIEAAQDMKVDVAELADKSQVATRAISERSSGATATVSVKASAESLMKKILSGAKNPAMPTGLRELDAAMNGGVRPTETSLLAARPSLGKSSLAAQISEYIVTADPSVAVLYVTLEMSHEMFTARLLAARSGVSMGSIRRLDMGDEGRGRLISAMMQLAERGLYFADSVQQTLTSIYAAARERSRLLARDGKRLGMIVIDHVGLVKPSAEVLKRANREQQVAETSRGLRFLATELNCHVMGIAHINREGEKSPGVPGLSSLRESGALENDTDSALIMHRHRDPMTGVIDESKPTVLSMAKGRFDGQTMMLLAYDGRTARFSDWQGDSHADFAKYYGASGAPTRSRG